VRGQQRFELGGELGVLAHALSQKLRRSRCLQRHGPIERLGQAGRAVAVHAQITSSSSRFSHACAKAQSRLTVRGEARARPRLLDGQAAVEPALDDPALPRMRRLQTASARVQRGQDLLGVASPATSPHGQRQLVEGDVLESAAALQGAPLLRVVLRMWRMARDASARKCSRLAVPMRFCWTELEVRLVDQRRGAQRVVAMPAPALPVRDQAELFVEIGKRSARAA
jgi:hypothetical protein